MRTLLLSAVLVSLFGAAAPGTAQQQSPGAWIEIHEPAEWRGEGTRGIGVQAGRSIRVAGVAHHPGGIQRVLINGARATLAPDPAGGTRFIGYVTAEPGAETVEVAAYPEGDRPMVRGFAIRPAPPENGPDVATAWTDAATAGFRGKRWAVIIGVSEYRDPRIQPLRFADADALALYDFLTSERAGLGGYDPANIRLLLNEEASYRNVRTALFDFLKAATEDDIVLIYFAGHGTPDPERLSELYLVTHDTDVDALAGTAFPMADVNAAVRRTYARDIIVITDACHSAGVAGHPGTRNFGINQINQSFLQQLQSTTGGIAVFTASEASQLSKEGEQWGGGHGVFTWSMLEALNGAADEDGDRIVTLGEMMEHVRDRVRRATRNAQIPTIGQTAFDRAWPMAIVLDPPAAVAAAPVPPPAPVAASVELSAAAVEFGEGEVLTISAVARTGGGDVLPEASFRWTSSDEAVAAVDPDGTVRGLAPGPVRIEAEAGAARGAIALRVLPVVAGISVEPRLELRVGETAELSARPHGRSGDPLERPVRWSTADSGTVRLSALGVVHALAVGEATVTVTSESVSEAVRVRVLPPPAAPAEPEAEPAPPPGDATGAEETGIPTSGVVADSAAAAVVALELDATVLELEVGDSVVLTARALAADGSLVSDRRLHLASSDTAVVSAGLIAKAPGRVTITARIDDAAEVVQAFVYPRTYHIPSFVAQSLVLPGLGHFRTGRTGRGMLALGTAAGSLAAGMLIEELHIVCAGPAFAGQCRDEDVLEESVRKPYLIYGIAGAVAVAAIAAIDAAGAASASNREAATLRDRWSRELGQALGVGLPTLSVVDGRPGIRVTVSTRRPRD